jgi:hypothetical protein
VDGVLGSSPIAGANRPGAGHEVDAAFSLVVDEGQSHVRRLPTLYFRTSPVFAHRQLTAVWERLERTLVALEVADRHPTYVMNACEIAGRRGLYARDLFSRSTYRRRLERRGMTFAHDPWVRFRGKEFECDDWGLFDPEFVILLSDLGDPKAIAQIHGGRVPFSISTYRLGLLKPEELRQLVKVLGSIDAVGSDDPSAVADHLSTQTAR